MSDPTTQEPVANPDDEPTTDPSQQPPENPSGDSVPAGGETGPDTASGG